MGLKIDFFSKLFGNTTDFDRNRGRPGLGQIDKEIHALTTNPST